MSFVSNDVRASSCPHSPFANREYRMDGMALKPQDIAVALKLCVYGTTRPSYSHIALELSMSPSEVHAAVKRAQASLLLHGSELSEMPNVSALEEFLVHG